MVKLTVYRNLDYDDKKKKHLINNLPTPPFRWILLGSTGSGKTNLLKNIVFNKKNFGYGKYFDEIYAWIGNRNDYIFFKNKMKQRNINNIKLFRDFNSDKVNELWDEIKSDDEEEEDTNEPNRILLIFDDMILEGISNRHKPTVLDDIFIRGRHFGVSILISTQIYTALNPNMRKENLSNLSVFFPMNEEQLKAIWAENITSVNRKQFLKSFKDNVNKRYSFINIDKNDPTGQLKNNEFDIIKID